MFIIFIIIENFYIPYNIHIPYIILYWVLNIGLCENLFSSTSHIIHATSITVASACSILIKRVTYIIHTLPIFFFFQIYNKGPWLNNHTNKIEWKYYNQWMALNYCYCYYTYAYIHTYIYIYIDAVHHQKTNKS